MFTPEGSVVVSAITSIFAAGVTYGVMSTKIQRLEKDLLDERHDRRGFEDKFVTMQHFRAVIDPIQQQLKEMGRDIKRVLVILSKHGDRDRDAAD